MTHFFKFFNSGGQYLRLNLPLQARNVALVQTQGVGFHRNLTVGTVRNVIHENPHSTPASDLSHKRAKGIELLRDPGTNKGMAFSLTERMVNNIHGLLPPAVLDMEEQVFRVMSGFMRQDSDLDRYMYLTALHDRNERLFYKVVGEYVEQMMPIVYTPTVGLACQKFGLIYRKPRGLYITTHDRGHVHDILCNWPCDDVKAVVVTDGERILGLGDLGAHGMGIPTGKLALYTALGGVDPGRTLPIMLDVGTNNEKLLRDPLYIGIRQRRVTGDEYIDLIDEFMEAIVRRYGHYCIVQFEDFASHNAFKLLQRYRDIYCCFNDDIQGTAAVGVGGLIASCRVTEKKLSDNVYLFQGAGGAATGIAQLLCRAMVQLEGISIEEARSKIWMFDVDGLLSTRRTEGTFTEQNEKFAKDHEPCKDLETIVKDVKPNVIIGAAAVPGAFTRGVLTAMAELNERPVVFALSNPTSKCECTAEEAYRYTEGRCVFASGSPFEAVELNYQTFRPGQGNNAYIFPGVALAVILFRISHITEDLFITAAEALAKSVTRKHLNEGRVYPPIADIPEISINIAVAVGEQAYEAGLAATYPRPENFVQHVRDHVYKTDYQSSLPTVYDWPQPASTPVSAPPFPSNE